MLISTPLKISPLPCLLLVVFTLAVASSPQAQGQKISEQPLLVAAPKDAIDEYHRLSAGKDILQVNDLSGANYWRDVAELTLFHQALLLGGFSGEVKLVESSTYKRMLRRLAKGRVNLIGTTVWRENAIESGQPLLLSEPLIRANEYRVGLYTTVKNSRARSVRNREDLKELTAVTSQHWSADWDAMSSLPFRYLHDSPHLTSMLKMVWTERVDVLLMAFSSNPKFAVQLSPKRPEQVLVPIPGVTVVLRDSRHWVGSQAEPLSREAFRALELGLVKLREQGRVKRAFQQVGVLDPRVQNWTVLNPSQDASAGP